MSGGKHGAAGTPSAGAALLARAVEHHGRGRIAEAEALYKQVLRIDPRNPNALNLLGVIHIQRGDGAGAVRLIEKAVGAAAKFPQARHNLGWALQTLGRWKDAEKQYRQAIALDPNLAESHNNLGNVLMALGRRDEARIAFERAVAVRPDYAEAHNNLGDLLRTEGDLDRAVAAFARALAANPDHAGAQNNLGIALLALDRPAEAEAAFRRATGLAPGSAVAWNGLGTALDQQERPDAAVAAYEQALAIDPGYAAAHSNLGVTYRGLGDYTRSIAAHRRAIELDPDDVQAHTNLGIAYLDFAQPDLAAAEFKRVLDLDPTSELGWERLCHAYGEMRDYANHIACARRLAELYPSSRSAVRSLVSSMDNIADWTDSAPRRQLDALIETALSANEPIPLGLFSYLHREDDPERQLKAATNAADRIEKSVERLKNPFAFDGRRGRARKLRVGYVSYDFRDHPVAHLLGGTLALFNRDRFEIAAYGYGADRDNAYRRRVADTVDRFVDITADSYEASAQRIYDDGIDILVDLMGHTGQARTPLFALRPAPVQVASMGFPGTMGASFIDYLIADAVVVPPGHERFYRERIVRMPHFYMMNDRTAERDAPVAARVDHRLPDDAFVLCSFNNADKFDPVMFGAWMRILRQVPDSILWLRTSQLVEANLKREASAAGVDPSRIVVAGRVAEKIDHIARVALSDLALDTRIFNGHTTTCDALWAGVPVLTLMGRHFPGRVAASALTVAGLPELIAHSMGEYEETAVRLAHDRPALQALRDRLATTRASSPLVDMSRWVRNMERAYLRMWQRFCDGLPPEGFDIVEP